MLQSTASGLLIQSDRLPTSWLSQCVTQLRVGHPRHFEKLHISRLRTAVLQLGYDFVAAPVEYRDSVQLNPSEVVKSTMDLKSHNPLPAYMVFPNEIPHFNAGVFVKNVRYANQAEWRIAVNRNERSYEPLILKLGNLTDIAHLTRRTELAEDLQRMRGCSVPYLTRGCFGTKTSQELSQDLFELGNEEVFITLTIG